MGNHLSKQQLENIKNYKYNTNDWTYMDLKFNPFWEYCVNSLSKVSIQNSLMFLLIFDCRESHRI